MDSVAISWAQIEKMVDNVCRQIQNLPLWNGLPYPLFKEWRVSNPRELWYGPEYVAVAKGGFIPAAMIAYWFDTHYANLTSTGQVFDAVERHRINASSGIHIIIDDIADTGRRLSQLHTVYSEENYGENHKFIFVTLVKRKTCPFQYSPDYHALTWNGSEWLVFPWAPHDIPQLPEGPTEDESLLNRGTEESSNLRMEPHSSGGGLPGDAPVQGGDGEVRERELEEGHTDSCDHRPSGESSEVPESSTPDEGTDEGHGPSGSG